MNELNIVKTWAMPNHNTFSIKPIKSLIDKYLTKDNGVWIDPFSRNSPFSAFENVVTNDLDESFEADYHKESLDFVGLFKSETVDGCLFDPPYSPRQIQECYNNIGRKVHQQDTQSSFYGDRKKEVARVIKTGGIVISFGWNSGGIGKSLGFKQIEILLVAHGGAHNDTICVVERKL